MRCSVLHSHLRSDSHTGSNSDSPQNNSHPRFLDSFLSTLKEKRIIQNLERRDHRVTESYWFGRDLKHPAPNPSGAGGYVLKEAARTAHVRAGSWHGLQWRADLSWRTTACGDPTLEQATKCEEGGAAGGSLTDWLQPAIPHPPALPRRQRSWD